MVKDAGKRETLAKSVNSIGQFYDSSILSVTAEVAELAANLRATASRKDRVLHIEDAIIAVTAMENKLVLVSRNRADFDVTEIEQVNP